MSNIATLNTKVSEDEKRMFSRTAESLGMNASTALKVFVKKFNECGGFPFDVRLSNNVSHPKSESFLHGISVVGSVSDDGHTVLPAEEYAEEDDIYDEYYPAP